MQHYSPKYLSKYSLPPFPITYSYECRGYPAEFKNDTHGQGILNHMLMGYEPYKGSIERVKKGAIISTASGETTAYALQSIEARGKLFIGPGTKVYPGMIIGESSRELDVEVNPVKASTLS